MGRVSLTKRYNVAQYEHEEYSIEVEIDEKSEAVEALVELKGMIQTAYETDAAKPAEEEKPKRGSKTKKDEEEDAEDEEEISEEDDAEEEGEEVEENDEEDEEEEVEEEEAPKRGSKKAAASSKKTAKKSSRSKSTPYDRTDELHKKRFTEALHSFFPKWNKTAEGKKKAKTVSLKLNGTAFLDSEGEFSDEFIGNLRKAWGSKK